MFDAAPLWEEAAATVVLSDPLLTREDVQAAFDEIAEKYRVTGLELRFRECPDGALQVIFEPTDCVDDR